MGRILGTVLVLIMLIGCAGPTAEAPEKPEKEGAKRVTNSGDGRKPAGSSSSAPEGNIPVSGVIGENVSGSTFDMRILDYFEAERFYYPTDPFLDMIQEYYSEAGKFVVVNYTVTNTSAGSISPTPIASLQVKGQGGIEVYKQHEEITPANRPAGPNYQMDDIPPRGMVISQFVFDVPTDVEPELLVVRDEPTVDSSFEVGNVDLTESVPQERRPEEVYALQNEYISMRVWEQAYDLFAQESKDRVSLDLYRSRQSTQKTPSAVTDYAFPSVEVQGDEATIERVLTVNEPEGEFQDRGTARTVMEDDGWKVVMRDASYEFFEGPASDPASTVMETTGP